MKKSSTSVLTAGSVMWNIFVTIGSHASHAPKVSAAKRAANATPTTKVLSKILRSTAKEFSQSHSDLSSIVEIELVDELDPFLITLKDELTTLRIANKDTIARAWSPKGVFVTREDLPYAEIPPHIEIMAEIAEMRLPFEACSRVADLAKKISSHVLRKRNRIKRSKILDNNSDRTKKGPNPVTNIYVQGFVNSGSVSHIEKISMTINQNVNQLQVDNISLAEKLSELTETVKHSEDLSETQKVELLDRLEVISVEAIKPTQNQMLHKVTDNLKGIADAMKGVGALKTIWDAAEPIIRGHFQI